MSSAKKRVNFIGAKNVWVVLPIFIFEDIEIYSANLLIFFFNYTEKNK